MQLLSHLGCDLLSLLAVSPQLLDLRRHRAVPHHQHRLCIWRPDNNEFRRRARQTCAALWQTNSPHGLLFSGSLRPSTRTTFFQFSVSGTGQSGTARFIHVWPVLATIKNWFVGKCSITGHEIELDPTVKSILPSSGDIWGLHLVERLLKISPSFKINTFWMKWGLQWLFNFYFSKTWVIVFSY